MDCQYLSLAATGHYPSLFLDYITQKDVLSPFYGHFPTLEAFREQIKHRVFDEQKRRTLVEVLERQYEGIPDKPDFSVLTDPRTFVVTTGHQLNLFTGPLYVPYKLITTINLAKKLQETYPDYHFVPIYWMAAEDHDFAEINHFTLFGKTYTWESTQRGAVGRMNPKGVETILKELPESVPLFNEAYLQPTLADAVRYYVHGLFGKEGLLCLDPDDIDLKRLFVPIIQDELLHQVSGSLIQQTNHQLESLGYRPQVAPRELNLFYLEEQLRERIVREDEDTYHIVNTDVRLSKSDLLNLVDKYPERFSPNVVLRPLYQETILPNLAYVGGPSEVPYWLQLKAAFDHYHLTFPLLVPRNFALYIPNGTVKRMEKLAISAEELFWDTIKLRRNYIERITENSLHLTHEKSCLERCFTDILTKAIQVDKSLEGSVLAEKAKLMNAIDNLEKRIQKAEERNYETVIMQLMALKNKLFPDGNLQERSENFLTFYLNDPHFIDKLLAWFDPLDYRMMVLMER